jgi:hypothetical protein
MIGLEDRQSLALGIHIAHDSGARLHLACQIVGIDLRTLQRWKAHDGLVAGDGRPQAVRPVLSHALSAAERAQLLRVANEPRFAAVPPARIVPMLADEGVYLASESSFTRVLRAHGRCLILTSALGGTGLSDCFEPPAASRRGAARNSACTMSQVGA